MVELFHFYYTFSRKDSLHFSVFISLFSFLFRHVTLFISHFHWFYPPAHWCIQLYYSVCETKPFRHREKWLCEFSGKTVSSMSHNFYYQNLLHNVFRMHKMFSKQYQYRHIIPSQSPLESIFLYVWHELRFICRKTRWSRGKIRKSNWWFKDYMCAELKRSGMRDWLFVTRRKWRMWMAGFFCCSILLY